MSTPRERICEAMLDLVAFRGYREVSVEDIVRQAGVQQRDFEELFSSKEDCALAVFDEIREDFGRCYRAAYEGESQWTDSIRAATYASVDWLAEHLREGRFALVEIAIEHRRVYRVGKHMTENSLEPIERLAFVGPRLRRSLCREHLGPVPVDHVAERAPGPSRTDQGGVASDSVREV